MKSAFLLFIICHITSCSYYYFNLVRRIEPDIDKIQLDSTGTGLIVLRYSGGSTESVYFARKKSGSERSLKTITNVPFNNPYRDSLKKEGISFFYYAKGCGYGQQVSKKNSIIKDTSIARLDSIWVDPMSGTNMIVNFRIKAIHNGKTLLIPDKHQRKQVLELSIIGDSIFIKGTEDIKTVHKKSIGHFLRLLLFQI